MAVANRTDANGSGDISATTDPAVPRDAQIVDGDTVLIWFGTDTTHARGSGTDLNGFTDHGVVDSGTDSSCTLLSKYIADADAEPATWTFTDLFAGNESGAYGYATYSGADPDDLFVVDPTTDTGSGSGEQEYGPIDTTGVDGCMIVQVLGCDPAAGRSWTDDASPDATERVDYTNGTLGNVFGQDFLQTTGGSISLGATPNGSEGSAGFIMALRPDAGAAVVDGAVSMGLTMGFTTAGQRIRDGAVSLPLAMGYTVAGTRIRDGAVSLPLAFSYTTTGTRIRDGAVSLPLTINYTTEGEVDGGPIEGAVSMALSMGYTTEGRSVKRGAVSLPLTMDFTVAGSRIRDGAATLPLTLNFVTSGEVIGDAEQVINRRMTMGMGT